MGEFSIWHWIVVLIFFGVILVPTIFYIIAVRNALEAIDPPLRPISPGLAWLYLVPVFNVIWVFFLVVYLKNGYEKMHAAGRLSQPTSAGFGVGIAYAICFVLSFIPGLNFIVLIPLIVLFILHWIQVNAARRLVAG